MVLTIYSGGGGQSDPCSYNKYIVNIVANICYFDVHQINYCTILRIPLKLLQTVFPHIHAFLYSMLIRSDATITVTKDL